MVLDAAYFEKRLPQSLEAIYYHKGVAAAADLARQMQRAFSAQFHVTTPLLVFDPANWERPFAEADAPGGAGGHRG